MINAYSTPEVMRIKDMIGPKETFLDIVITSPILRPRTFIRQNMGIL